MKINKPTILISTLLLITTILWYFAKPDTLTYLQTDTFTAFSQIFALMGIVLMSISLLLATRFKPVEDLFGGLDKVYINHAIIGSLAFVLILAHPIFLVLQHLSSPKVAGMYLFPGSLFAYNLGIFALYLMILSFIFIVFVKLPYHIWKTGHQFMGLVFILSGMHTFNIGSDIAESFILRNWIRLFVIIGVASFIYTLVFYKKLGPRYLYKVEKIDKLANISTFYLKPVRKSIKYMPGQFGYFSFLNAPVSQEKHPFTFSSDVSDDFLRISVKTIGDYTSKLTNVTEGTNVLVYGPYGHFYKPYSNQDNDLICIAGGIGITPFLGLLRNAAATKSNRNITLYFVYKCDSDGEMFTKEINELSKNIPNLKTIYWCSTDQGHFDIFNATIFNQIDQKATYMLCGPLGLMNSVTKYLTNNGISKNNIVSENFEMI